MLAVSNVDVDTPYMMLYSFYFFSQMLTRLEEKSSLQSLFPSIPESTVPRAGDVIEVCGGEGSGKSALVLSWLLNALLPTTFETISIGGCDLEVFLFDNDRKLSIVHLSILLEKLVENILKRKMIESPDILEEMAASLTKQALKNLTLLSCDSPWEFALSLRRVVDIFKSEKQSRSRLIIVDSLSCFYFIEKQLSLDSRRNFDDLQFLWTSAIDKLVKEFGTTVIVTKLALLFKGTKATPAGDSRFIESLNNAWCRLVTHKFELTDGKVTILIREKMNFITACELNMKIVDDGMVYLCNNK